MVQASVPSTLARCSWSLGFLGEMRTIIILVGSPHSAVMRESADTVSSESCGIVKHRTITRAPLLLFSCPDTDSVIFPEDSILSQLEAREWALGKAR